MTTTAPRVVDHEDGVTWIAHPDETMQRASHALDRDGETWLIDPVDVADRDALLEELPPVAGVVLLLDRHTRDADRFAEHADVPVYLPRGMSGVATDLDARIEWFDQTVAGFDTHSIVRTPVWHETALADDTTLVIPEALGTAGYFLAGEERLGVHPMLRLTPPRGALSGLTPERILVGHGEPVLSGATSALSDALAGSRRRSPRLVESFLREAVGRP